MSKTYALRDLVATMRETTSVKVARGLIANARNRLGDIEHIGWPRLEKSLRDELLQLEAIARQKGLAS